jgi:dipeptidyl aminopeptidase/acylaminoacyl peptidase
MAGATSSHTCEEVNVLMATKCALGAALMVAAAAAALPTAAPAAYPGVNGAVAFTSTQDGGARHIFTRRSGQLVDLTGVSSSVSEIQPKFSPDGREIVFTRLATGLPNAEIFVMSAQGTGRVQLTHTPTGNSDPTWSPDGTQIAFVSARNHEIPQIFVMRSDGTDLRQITHDTAGKSQLAWSPTGHSIAFVRVPAGGGDREIYSIRPDGSGLADLTHDPASYDVEPAWSPDGARIAFSGPFHATGSVGADLWIMNANGSNKHELDHENNGYSDGAYPAWSPDGTTIAFAANNGSGYYHVWSVPATGGQNTELVTNAIPGGNPGDEEVDWQPAPTDTVPKTRLIGSRIAGHRASFSFEASGPATGYRCELQLAGHRAKFTPCSSPQAYGHLAAGRYTFSVVAFGPGEPYHAPARRKFRIG